MMIRSAIVTILCSILALTACTKETSEKALDGIVQNLQEDSLFRNYFTEKNIDSIWRDPSGLKYRIQKTGSVESIKPTSVPTVIFTTKLLNGKVVQSSQGLPTNFDGRMLKEHIPGWQIGIPKIGKGGRIMLFIPSALAYGSAGISNLVPPNSPLVCEIDLVDFKD
ncbi:FKBP-type peptidyl-prolyl cis-trans isomerase [uncultured Chitinophaga sp.]|uniref:FKBP-type peptidyl-prolyl cis-trans isomerase n=1 Tax=uncultured Chitinophaga sp. TaxID=339340 RepID=UPI0025DBFD8E|nr:FKBP-type peptidyl-prolyl cis-trans isomerase [uncultured Chitinophaga sp.]